MAIPILNHLNVKGNINLNDYKLNDFVVDHSTEGNAGTVTGKLIFDTNVLKFYNGSAWQTLGTASGTMSSFQLEDGDGTEVTINDAKEVKFIDGKGLQINWSDVSDGSDGDPYDLTFELDLSNGLSDVTPTNGDKLLTLDSDGSAQQLTTVAALATLFAGTGLTATDSVIAVDTLNQDTTGTADHVTITDNENTNEENQITFIEGAGGAGSQGLEADGDFTYNPSTGTVSATIFKGNIDAVDGDFDGTLETDALSIGGTTVGSTAAELNLLDGSAKSTSSITIDDADAILIIDGTTTKQIPASDISTYAALEATALAIALG